MWRVEFDEKVMDLFYLSPGKKFWVDPNHGSDGNPGTRSLPRKTFAGGYDLLRDGHHDTLFMAPGNYIQTATVSLSKDDTNLIGLSENVEGDYTQGGVNLYTVTTSVVHAIDITGERVHLRNMKVTNAGANAANLGAVFVEGAAAFFKNVNMMGIMTAEQIASANPYSLGIGKGGYFPIFEDCVIGQSTWGARTQTASGHLKFTGTGAGDYPPDGGVFRRCRFLSQSATNTLAMVYVPNLADVIDRMWLFDECVFYNFNSNQTAMLRVFEDAENSAHHIVLKRCTAVGYAEWQTADAGWIVADMPITGVGGGLSRAPTGTVGS